MSASKTSVANIAALFQQVKAKRDKNFISKLPEMPFRQDDFTVERR